MKIGSLFDGSGGFPLAASMFGIEPIWLSEVEPYPIAVTKNRFPQAKHLGDMSKVNGAEIEPVDIITFGSPCQDLSIAGTRSGLKHKSNGDETTTRSGLFMEAIRIIKEMREKTNGIYPRFAIWENVPGAFSSNKGQDFKTVIEEFVKVREPEAPALPMPEKGWPYADCIMGDGWSIAYRTFDAQYWGVAQRRRRIYLVADFRGQCASKILFEQEGLRGYFETCRTPWKDLAVNAERSIGAGDIGGCLTPWDVQSRQIYSENVKAYDARGNGDGQTVNTITGDHNNRITDYSTLVVVNNIGGQSEDAKENDTLGSVVCISRPPKYIVRRLTPTECARLQGFPDEWGHLPIKEIMTDEEREFWQSVRNTYAEINGKQKKEYTKDQMIKWYNRLHTESSEYKMWGNGIALPNALYVMQGIVEVCHE